MKKVSNDYRLYKDDNSLSNISNKKIFFLQENLLKKSQWVYEVVHLKENEEYKKFKEIYSGKCAYCGKPAFHSIEERYEIDHFDPSKKINERELSKEEQIDNLIYACSSCNMGKQFVSKERDKVPDEFFRLINPDTNINKVFYRNEKYEIKIYPKYEKKKYIVKFYNKMHFNNTIVRFYYMICVLDYMMNNTTDQRKKEKYNNAISEIRKIIQRIPSS